MPGSLTLTIGPLSATKLLAASNADLSTAVRRAAEELGYEGDATNDPAQVVADWFVSKLVQYARDASKSKRVNQIVKQTRTNEELVNDPFDE